MNTMQCDIILLSYESPDLLKECVRSVLERTRVKSRLIIVDNASKDPEVIRYLQQVHGNDTVRIEKIFSEDNAGYAGGMNKGIRFSEAPLLCLLNNDCVVTGGWLEEMIAVAESRNEIGLVNPQSNTFGSVPGKGISPEVHAGSLADRRGKFVELGHAIGFACLVKREVMNAIGHLDEAYEGVCYEDTDFSIRAQKEGYISVMAEAAYVFHHEQASRKTLKGREEIYRKNRELFERKWGKLLRVFFFVGRTGVDDRHLALGYYETLKGLARQRAIVDMWVATDFGPAIRHADIGVCIFTRGPVAPAVLWRVLTKKKRYDAVILKEGLLSGLLGALRFLHGAEILTMEGTRLHGRDGRRFDLKDPLALAESLRTG